MNNFQIANQQKISLNGFNKVSEEFFQKIIATFPNEKKFSVYYMKFKLGKQTSIRMPMEYVMSTMIPYGKQVMTKDEQFFKADSYVKAAESFSNKSGLVDMWNSMDDATKNDVWDYMQSMYVLGMRAMGLDEQLNDIIKEIKI